MPVVEEFRTLTGDGRIVIPWVVQEALGLAHGGQICFHVENGVVTLHARDNQRTEMAVLALLGRGDQSELSMLDELRTELRMLELIAGQAGTAAAA